MVFLPGFVVFFTIMLPEVLAGSYSRYKEDTTVFTTWLSKAAMACGYQAPKVMCQNKTATKIKENQGSAGRLKGKARKEAKDAAGASKGSPTDVEPPSSVTKYEITTQELLKQADAIAASKKAGFEIPQNIVRVVQRAIDARKRCAAWFQKTGVHHEDGSTARHLHFIGVLEKALNALRPPGSVEPSPPKPKDTLVTLEESNQELANRFGALDFEDLDEALNVSASDVVIAKEKPAKGRGIDLYELEGQSEIDYAFVIFCFFEDLHRVQDALKATWESYKARTCELVVASVITNLAFNFVRRAEEEIISLDPKRYSKPRSYDALSLEIFYAESFSKGEDPEAKLASSESLKITPFDDFIYLPTARILMKFQRLMELDLGYPQPVPPFRFSYISRPELLELPMTKKKEKEDLLLSQILIDSSLNDIIREGSAERTGQKPPVEDEFSNALECLRKAREISVWIVFASRIVLDIQDILGRDVERGYNDLRSTTQDALKVLDFHVEGDELVPGGNGECWHVKDADLPLKIHNSLKYWVVQAPLPSVKALCDQKELGQDGDIDDLPPETRERVMSEMRARGLHNDDVLPEHKATAEKLDLKPIKPAKDPNFLYAQNPLYGGTLMFNLALDMEKAGITFANHHLTIFAMAHLYNLLQQTKVIKGNWPELDRIIQLHIGQLFAGQLPTRPSECHTRLSIRMGTTANAFARNQRAPRGSSRQIGKGMKHLPKFAISESSEVLRQYSSHSETMEKSLPRIEAVMQIEKKKAQKRLLTPLQFLAHVRRWLPQVMTDTRTDYITMTRTCNKLLKRVRRRIHQQLDYLYPLVDEGYSNDHGILYMVASIIYQAAETQVAKEHMVRERDRQSLPQHPHLEVAGEVVQEYLEKHGASWVVDLD